MKLLINLDNPYSSLLQRPYQRRFWHWKFIQEASVVEVELRYEEPKLCCLPPEPEPKLRIGSGSFLFIKENMHQSSEKVPVLKSKKVIFKVSYKTILNRGRKKYFWLRNTAEAAYDHVKSYRKPDVQVNFGSQWGVDDGKHRPITMKRILRRVLESIFKIGK